MSLRVMTDGVLREQWDDTTRTYSAWTSQGAVVAGTPRAYTAAENTKADADIAALAVPVNRATIEGRAITALGLNDTYRAIASPTNAQVVAQVDLLTRECSGLIRLLLSRLDTTTGT